jgi:cyclopropane fatty-acyl-phospholipid synthase-like methyltransferase
MKKKTQAMLLGVALAFAVSAIGAELDVKQDDSVQSLLAAQKGKRVTVRTRSGQEFTGTVKTVSPKLVQVSQVAGKEFFDAVVPLEAVEAVLVRTKD